MKSYLARAGRVKSRAIAQLIVARIRASRLIRFRARRPGEAATAALSRGSGAPCPRPRRMPPPAAKPSMPAISETETNDSDAKQCYHESEPPASAEVSRVRVAGEVPSSVGDFKARVKKVISSDSLSEMVNRRDNRRMSGEHERPDCKD